MEWQTISKHHYFISIYFNLHTFPVISVSYVIRCVIVVFYNLRSRYISQADDTVEEVEFCEGVPRGHSRLLFPGTVEFPRGYSSLLFPGIVEFPEDIQ